MVSGALSTRVDAWLDATLKADATLAALVGARVFPDDTAPAAVTFPYVRTQFLSGVSVSEIAGVRILETFVYLVEGIAQSGTWTSVQPVADAIYFALHRATGSVTGAQILSCVCEEEVRRAESDEGVRYRYLGWRCRIQAAVGP
jgi:hypothetical protein